MIPPIGQRLLAGNLIDLLRERHFSVRVVYLFQHSADGLLCLFGQSPRLDISRPTTCASVRNIKDIAHTHSARTGSQ